MSARARSRSPDHRLLPAAERRIARMHRAGWPPKRIAARIGLPVKLIRRVIGNG